MNLPNLILTLRLLVLAALGAYAVVTYGQGQDHYEVIGCHAFAPGAAGCIVFNARTGEQAWSPAPTLPFNPVGEPPAEEREESF